MRPRDSDRYRGADETGTGSVAEGDRARAAQAASPNLSHNLSSPPPVDSKGVVERLREYGNDAHMVTRDKSFIIEAADLIDRLTASEERLREALQRLVTVLTDYNYELPEGLAVVAIENARQALGEDNAS